MPSPTERNGFRKPDPGSDNNTWGDNLNTAVFDLVDNSLDGWTTINTSGTTTLTSTQYVDNQARQRCIKYTALTSGTLVIPGVEKWYIVWAENANVTVTTGGSVSHTVVAGSVDVIICDGADVTKVQSNDFNGAELTNLGTPTSNSSATTKLYVDQQAFASTNLPGINPSTDTKFVTNDGVGAFWDYITNYVDINGLTQDSLPDLVNDFFLSYDASAGALKKVKPADAHRWQQIDQSVVSGTVSAITLSSIPQTFNELLLTVENLSHNDTLNTRSVQVTWGAGMSSDIGNNMTNTQTVYGSVWIPDYKNRVGLAIVGLDTISSSGASGQANTKVVAYYGQTAGGTSEIQVRVPSASIDSGTVTLYGR